MRCYLEGYRDDRTCDICKQLNKKIHDRCNMKTKIHRNSNILQKCNYCNIEKAWERGTNEYGYDVDYESTEYICSKTNIKCKPAESCLDMFIEIYKIEY